jgi:hypothetical protein
MFGDVHKLRNDGGGQRFDWVEFCISLYFPSKKFEESDSKRPKVGPPDTLEL